MQAERIKMQVSLLAHLVSVLPPLTTTAQAGGDLKVMDTRTYSQLPGTVLQMNRVEENAEECRAESAFYFTNAPPPLQAALHGTILQDVKCSDSNAEKPLNLYFDFSGTSSVLSSVLDQARTLKTLHDQTLCSLARYSRRPPPEQPQHCFLTSQPA